MNLISHKFATCTRARWPMRFSNPPAYVNKEFPPDNRAFIHIYGDLSYAREAGTATLSLSLALLFFGILPSSAVPPHRILFPLVGRSMRREFGDYKYRNGHGPPLKDAGGTGVRRSSSSRGVIGKEVVDRASRFRVYELAG